MEELEMLLKGIGLKYLNNNGVILTGDISEHEFSINYNHPYYNLNHKEMMIATCITLNQLETFLKISYGI